MFHDPENELVSWTAAPANRVSFPSGTNGTEIVVHGDNAGDVTLTAHIEGYAGPPPICAAKVVPDAASDPWADLLSDLPEKKLWTPPTGCEPPF